MLILLLGVFCSEVIHFTQSVYNVTVNETALPDYPRPPVGFLTVECVTMYAPVTYTIEPTTTPIPFDIDTTTGQLNATHDIDYDSQEDGFEMYSFNVTCSDIINTTTAVVEVYINPINEYIPEINPEIILNITETTPSGTLLLSSLPGGLTRLRVEDKDRGIHGQVNFSLLSPLDNYHFSFVPDHANLTLVRAIDFETETNISSSFYQEIPLKIRACDTTTPTEQCPIIYFPLYIVASDDNIPVFLNDTYTATINETTTVGSTVTVLECTDADVHIGGIESISLFNPSSEVESTFSLGELSDNGSISVILNKELDYDKSNRSYEFQVSCNDSLHMTTANVIIHVLDVNDNVPTFIHPYAETVFVFEPIPSGHIIHSVECIDEDEGINGDIVYEILPQHYLFAVDKQGHILTNIPIQLPEFTDFQTHNITIQCKDMGTPSLASSKILTLVIDITPPHTISNITIYIPENIPLGTRVLIISNYNISTDIIISNQTQSGTFIISPISIIHANHPHYHGYLIVNGTIDREYIDIHHIELTTSNTSYNAVIEVIVQDVNDNAPNCNGHRVLAIKAGYYSNTHLLTLACCDNDEGLNQQLIYQLTTPSLSDIVFTINETSGDISMNGDIYEGNYHLTVVVTDRGIPMMNTSIDILLEVTQDRDVTTSSMTLIIILVIAMLVLVGVVSGCGLCFCYSYKVHSDKQKKNEYCIRYIY